MNFREMVTGTVGKVVVSSEERKDGLLEICPGNTIT